MSTSTQRSRAVRLLLSASAAISFGVAASPAHAIVADDREELPIASTSPQTDVVASVVRLHVPMLPGAAAHDEACDWIAYQRWRHVDGPTEAKDSDSVVVLQPGVLEGAAAFDQVARNTVRASAARGKHIEVWGIDRRANCMEDKTGLELAEQTNDPSDAIDYYYNDKVIDGRKFAGWNKSNRVLADIGVAQVVHDQYSVLTSELPDQAWREKRVICGGHSMGGPVTEIFASWDFDGNKATTADAGWRQCAGFIGLDTQLKGGMANSSLITKLTGGLVGGITNLSVAGLKSGVIPRYVDLLGISPQTMMFLELIGIGADLEPEGEITDVVRNAPRTRSVDDFLKLSGSPDLASWLRGADSLRNFRWTRMALLGQILDDNAGVYGLVRLSFGYPTGTSLRINRLPDQVALIPGLGQLVTKGRLMLPQKSSATRLQSWANYDELGSGASQIGAGVTAPELEIADAAQVARAIHEGPLNLTEDWFPIRLILEQFLLASGDRAGSLAGSMHGGTMTRKPRIVVKAGDGISISPTQVDPTVVAPGYQHLDVLMANERQNDGKPEIASTTIANLITVATKP